jgi:hypothetical protein
MRIHFVRIYSTSAIEKFAEVNKLALVNIHLLQNSVNVTFSKSQKSHYARTRVSVFQ